MPGYKQQQQQQQLRQAILGVIVASLAFGTLAQNSGDYEAACSSLASSSSTTFSALNTTIFNATFYAEPADNVATLGVCQPTANISVPLCRIQFYTNTSDISAIMAEMWLPTNYSGRMLALGNGGLDGCESIALFPFLRAACVEGSS